MIRFYPIVIVLQVFCLYHAYTKKSDQKWFWIIIIFPFIGSCIYLYHHFYSKRNIAGIKEGIKETLIDNYTINKLEQRVKFSDTFSNKLELAKEHINAGNYQRAIELLNTCLTPSYEDDLDLNLTLLRANYLNEDFEQVVYFGNKLANEKEFQDSSEMVAFAWSNFKIGQMSEADKRFQQLDKHYSNYEYRMEYAEYLYETNRKADALEKLNELIEEIDSMDSYERRLNRKTKRKINSLYDHMKK